jgi:hypothetical protein
MMTVGFPGRYFCTNVATAFVRRSPVPPGSLPYMIVTVLPWKNDGCAKAGALIEQNTIAADRANTLSVISFNRLDFT